LSIVAARTPAVQAQTISLDALDQLNLVNVKAEKVTFKGRKALRVSDPAAVGTSDQEQLVILSKTDFQDGIIEVDLAGEPGPTALLFSESPSRIVITFDAAEAHTIQEIAERNHAPFAIIGRVGGSDLRITVERTEVVAASVSNLEEVWRTALSSKLQAELVSS